MKITYLNRREGEKRFRWVIWDQKLTLNHPSLVDEGEEIRVSALGSQKRGWERGRTYYMLKIIENYYSIIVLVHDLMHWWHDDKRTRSASSKRKGGQCLYIYATWINYEKIGFIYYDWVGLAPIPVIFLFTLEKGICCFFYKN